MSNKPVMSHDPLAAVAESAADTETPAGDTVLSLPDSLTIVEAGDFHQVLSGRVVEQGELRIDGAAVESIDGAGLQLLAAFVRELVGKSSVVSWVGVSEPLAQGAALLGLEDALQLNNRAEAA